MLVIRFNGSITLLCSLNAMTKNHKSITPLFTLFAILSIYTESAKCESMDAISMVAILCFLIASIDLILLTQHKQILLTLIIFIQFMNQSF
jgi:hypothetical protein